MGLTEELFTPDCMVDIETLSSEHNAVVVSIGAVAFDINVGILDKNGKHRDYADYYCVLDTIAQIKDGRHVNRDTRRWWVEQTESVRDVLNESIWKLDSHPHDVMKSFLDWCERHNVKRIWGNGNTFDNMVLRNLCKQYNVAYPVQFRFDMDMRTLGVMYGSKVKIAREGDHHNALDDAFHQAKIYYKMYKDLRQ